jgi:hypothetical protein
MSYSPSPHFPLTLYSHCSDSENSGGQFAVSVALYSISNMWQETSPVYVYIRRALQIS